MLDFKTLELIKNNQFSEGTNFPEDLHKLIHEFYDGFDLDRQNNEYREDYIRHFIEQHEDFIVNYQTNVYDPNINTSDKLSDELTFNKFLDTVSAYLTKFYDEDENRG